MQLLECGLQRVRRLGAEGARLRRSGARSGAGEGWGVRRYNRPRSILEEGANTLMDSQTIRQKHKDFLFPCVANYYAEPVVITEAHGSTVKDLDGRERSEEHTSELQSLTNLVCRLLLEKKNKKKLKQHIRHREQI